MKSVVLVGAGATLAESLPSRPSRDRVPPLDATFFELCKLANLEGQSTVRSYLTKTYGLDPFAKQFGMEEVFNLIYSDAMSATASAKALNAYWALLQMYRESIIRTTNGLKCNSHYGVGALLCFLLGSNRKMELTFVTFNHDLLIEKAIDHAISIRRYSRIPWDITLAYELAFEEVATRVGGAPVRTNIGEQNNSIKVIKLHGSLNWVYPVRSANDARNSIRVSNNNLYCINDRRIYKSMSLVGGPRAQHLLPLIVPPIYEKANHIRERLSPLWDAAQSAIAEADQLIIFGYSFPDADIPSKGMFRRAIFQNKELRQVHVIDVNPYAGGKVAELLGTPVVSQYRTVRDFGSTFAWN